MTPAVETVDVDDICHDIDRVGIFPLSRTAYRAVAFRLEEHDPEVLTQLDVDLREYPAVVELVKRAADIPRDRVRFRPLRNVGEL